MLENFRRRAMFWMLNKLVGKSTIVMNAEIHGGLVVRGDRSYVRNSLFDWEPARAAIRVIGAKDRTIIGNVINGDPRAALV